MRVIRATVFLNLAEHPDIYSVFVAAIFGSILSVFATDFLFPFRSDLGYLAVVAKFYDEPQFANSAYFQSYRFFPSGFWMTLQGLSPYLNMYWTFLVLFFISRFLTFIGFLSCARLFGVRSLWSYLLFSSVIASSFLLRGVSLAGGNGLFIEYFTHSELDNGLFLLSISQLIRQRIAVSTILLGIIGFINAFFAIWVLFPLTTILSDTVYSERYCSSNNLQRGDRRERDCRLNLRSGARFHS